MCIRDRPGPGHPRGGFRKPKNAKRALARILSYMARRKWMLVVVALCILVSAGAGIMGTYLLKPLINEGIVPLIGTSPTAQDFAPFVLSLIHI